jgi:hypothetical protein
MRQACRTFGVINDVKLSDEERFEARLKASGAAAQREPGSPA